MSDNSELVLHTKDLVKRYKNRTVVKGVSVEVRQGEIVGLLGPNGAGKTTTFYMIVGLIQPNEGEIYLNEDLITREPVYKRAQKVSAIWLRKPAYSATSVLRTISRLYLK